MSKLFILLGICFLAAGFAIAAGVKLPSWFGRLPGDMLINRAGLKVYVPLTTCLLISIILTLIFSLLKK
jgi:hypothetical protein